MIYLELPEDTTPRPLPFYLAMEEFAARNYDDEIFFMWQVDPTVIFGRHQMMERELDADYCRRNSISVYRRKSGGGCVFADRNNVMFSYITPSRETVTAFGSYCRRVAGMLKELGLEATYNTRNDILIDGRKVSGNAFYRAGSRSIVHGTMLYDTDIRHMTGALTPSSSKLSTKGVSSVRSRITTVREHLPELSLDEFLAHARRCICDGESIRLSPDDIMEIEKIAAPYYTPEWIYGHNPEGRLIATERIEGVGEFIISASVEKGIVTHLDIAGDFFVTGDLRHDLITPLEGARFSRDDFAMRLDSGRPAGEVIPGLTRDAFLNMIFSAG